LAGLRMGRRSSIAGTRNSRVGCSMRRRCRRPRSRSPMPPAAPTTTAPASRRFWLRRNHGFAVADELSREPTPYDIKQRNGFRSMAYDELIERFAARLQIADILIGRIDGAPWIDEFESRLPRRLPPSFASLMRRYA